MSKFTELLTMMAMLEGMNAGMGFLDEQEETDYVWTLSGPDGKAKDYKIVFISPSYTIHGELTSIQLDKDNEEDCLFCEVNEEDGIVYIADKFKDKIKELLG